MSGRISLIYDSSRIPRLSHGILCIDGPGCEVMKLPNKWELGVVIDNYEEPRLLYIEQICAPCLPRS